MGPGGWEHLIYLGRLGRCPSSLGSRVQAGLATGTCHFLVKSAVRRPLEDAWLVRVRKVGTATYCARSAGRRTEQSTQLGTHALCRAPPFMSSSRMRNESSSSSAVLLHDVLGASRLKQDTWHCWLPQPFRPVRVPPAPTFFAVRSASCCTGPPGTWGARQRPKAPPLQAPP